MHPRVVDRRHLPISHHSGDLADSPESGSPVRGISVSHGPLPRRAASVGRSGRRTRTTATRFHSCASRGTARCTRSRVAVASQAGSAITGGFSWALPWGTNWMMTKTPSRPTRPHISHLRQFLALSPIGKVVARFAERVDRTDATAARRERPTCARHATRGVPNRRPEEDPSGLSRSPCRRPARAGSRPAAPRRTRHNLFAAVYPFGWSRNQSTVAGIESSSGVA